MSKMAAVMSLQISVTLLLHLIIMSCPVCTSPECFVSRIWEDEQLMDILLAENGSSVVCTDILIILQLYTHYDQTWIEFLTHYFVYVFERRMIMFRTHGKVEATLREIKGVFQKDGFVPSGLENLILHLEKEKSITIYRPNNSTSYNLVV